MKSINGGLHCCSFLAIVTGHLVSWSTSLLAILAVFCYNVAAMAMLFCFHGNCETVKLVLDNIELINNNQCTSECRCLLKIILITGNQLFFSQVKPTCLRGLLFINTVYTHQVLDFASHWGLHAWEHSKLKKPITRIMHTLHQLHTVADSVFFVCDFQAIHSQTWLVMWFHVDSTFCLPGNETVKNKPE